MSEKNKNKIPFFVKDLLKNILDFSDSSEAYIVGGSVRDILLEESPIDWDVATNLKPEEIQNIFPDSFYENDFGTVGVKIELKDKTKVVVEVTSYRKESKYSDKRHPDDVVFVSSLKEDLSRRDFTINALAMDINGNVIDLHKGKKDLEQGIIRCVGEASDRFAEDALRMLRAVRFAALLDFEIEEKTKKSIKNNINLIDFIAKERIGIEMYKMFLGKASYKGIELMKEAGLLEKVLPEVYMGAGVSQNKHHKYDVYTHNLYSLRWADENSYPAEVKIAALLHDVAKPQTKFGEGINSTFYGHEIEGASVAYNICNRFRWENSLCKKVSLLVRHHMFYYEIDEVTERSVRRIIAKIGSDNMKDLVKLRICDRMGSGVAKPEPYRLRHFQFMIEKVQKDPVSVNMLKVNGTDVIKELSLSPSPRVGHILYALLEDVLDFPEKNNKEYLLERAKKLNELSEEELALIRYRSKDKEKDENIKKTDNIKKKYYLQ